MASQTQKDYFSIANDQHKPQNPATPLKLAEVNRLEGDILWLKYRV